MRVKHIILLLFALTAGGLQPVQAEELDWPLSIKAALSSSFGETRPASGEKWAAYFHFGIDLKTWGKTGYEVRAVADGRIVRLRTSPWGYGRAIYQQLEDGRLVVYAHLEGFAAKLAAPVEEAQRARTQYSVNLWFAEDALVVKRGELIGWSGRSGGVPPHLHLEVRDGANRPLNPLMHGYTLEDSRPPTLQRIALIPFGPGSTVNGSHEPVSLALRWDAPTKQFVAAEIPLVYGRLGVAVLVYDRADGADNKLAPYYTALSVDGESLFAAGYDRFAIGDRHQVALDRTRLSYPGGSGQFYNLFWAPGNRLTFYSVARGDDGLLHCGVDKDSGEVFLDKGLHLLEVVAEDIAGNQSRVHMQLRVNAPPALIDAQLNHEEDAWYATGRIVDADDAQVVARLAHSKRGDKWKTVEEEHLSTAKVFRMPLPVEANFWRLEIEDEAGAGDFHTWAQTAKKDADKPQLNVLRRIFSDFVTVTIESDQALAEPPQVQLVDKERDHPLVPRQLGLRQYRVVAPFMPTGGETLVLDIVARYASGAEVGMALALDQRSVTPTKAVQLDFDNGAVALNFPQDSAYKLFFPQVEKWQPEAAEDLQDIGIAYALSPDGTTFDQKVAIALRYPAGISHPERLGIYEASANGKWGLVDNDVDIEGGVVKAQIRRFGRFAVLADLTPPTIARLRPAAAAVVEIKRPLLSARVEDKGSGIVREEDVVMELDGRKLISEYYPGEDAVRYLVEEDLAAGAHELVVVVRDASGNEATARSIFVVRQEN